MNSLQIEKILKRDPKVSKYFLGCFSANTIPSKPCASRLYPYCAVVNTDNSNEPGTHWIAIYVSNSTNIEYFDSFALQPNEIIQDYLSQFSNIKHSKVQLQTINSTVCGQYAIYFISNRCYGDSFDKIEKHLSTECKSHSNKVVNSFVARRFDLIS